MTKEAFTKSRTWNPSQGAGKPPAVSLYASHKVDIAADQLCCFFRPHRTVHTQFILVGIAPYMTGNTLVVGSSGAVRAGNVFLALLLRIAVHLHDLFHTVGFGCVDKNTHHVLPVPKHIIRCPAHNDTRPHVRNHIDCFILRNHRLLDSAGAEIQFPHGGVFIRVDAGDKLPCKTALLSGQRGHFLVIAGNPQLLRHQLADAFSSSTMFTGNGDDHAGAGALQDRPLRSRLDILCL